MISLDLVKELREATGVSISKCKQALEETNGDMDKAKDLLRKWGQAVADKRCGRETSQGIIDSYIHLTKKIGVLVDLRCETDFVAKSPDFTTLAHDIAMHIAASNPKYLKPEDVPTEVLDKEKEIYIEEAKQTGKPADMIEKIIENKLNKFKEENSLYTQKFIKNPDITIDQYINEYVAKIGEKIIISKFVRLDI